MTAEQYGAGRRRGRLDVVEKVEALHTAATERGDVDPALIDVLTSLAANLRATYGFEHPADDGKTCVCGRPLRGRKHSCTARTVAGVTS